MSPIGLVSTSVVTRALRPSFGDAVRRWPSPRPRRPWKVLCGCGFRGSRGLTGVSDPVARIVLPAVQEQEGDGAQGHFRAKRTQAGAAPLSRCDGPWVRRSRAA
jgi:hypothetical protein